MSLFLLVLAATALGLLLIPLLGRGQRTSPAAREAAPALQAVGELAWVRDHGLEGFERLLAALFTEMGFAIEPGERGGGVVGFHASDPAPIRGGRIYVHGVLAAPGEPVDGDDVRGVVDAARAEAVGKAVLVTLGRFSPDAREAARDNPVDLVDGDALAALVRKHLPQVWATRTV